MSLNVEKFQGTVHLKHYQRDPRSGRMYQGAMGLVSIMAAKDATGLDVSNPESNWIARVESPSGNVSYNFPGCQVNGVHAHPEQVPPISTPEIIVAGD